MVYLIINETKTKCKIGYSGNPKARFSQIQTSTSERLILKYIIIGDRDFEMELHTKFHEHYDFREWFNYHEDIISFFDSRGQIDVDATNIINRRMEDNQVMITEDRYNQLLKIEEAFKPSMDITALVGFITMQRKNPFAPRNVLAEKTAEWLNRMYPTIRFRCHDEWNILATIGEIGKFYWFGLDESELDCIFPKEYDEFEVLTGLS